MPKGPKGEKRPTDVVSTAVLVARIATGEETNVAGKAPKRAVGGKIGGKSRAKSLSEAERKEIAKKGAEARWKKS